MCAGIQLGKRLAAVAAMVRPGNRVADIGTDHAYLPVFLLQNGTCPSAIAADIRSGPAASAARTVAAAGLADRISVRLGDGLSPVAAGEAADIVIAGMGGETIAEILAAAGWVRDPAIHLVLQPMSKPERLRRFLMEQGFAILEERVAREDGRLYAVISAAYTGHAVSPKAAACYLGAIPHTTEGMDYIERHRTRLLKRAAGLAGAGGCPEEIKELRQTAAEMGDWLDNGSGDS